MSDLYDNDFVLWSEHQAELLRRRAAGELGNDTDLDWPNIAEEIESLGQSERSELRSLIGTVIEHLIKLEASPAIEPRNGWKDTIDRARDDIDLLMKDSPSLRRFVGEMVADGIRRAGRRAARSLERFGEQSLVEIDSLTFTEEQVLGEWLP
ncbi:MAG: DUF29 domain-containing protein [Rhodopila sp.]|jgi:hypothetical protein